MVRHYYFKELNGERTVAADVGQPDDINDF